MIYLDNAATSRPKPPSVAEAMSRFLEETGANPGRSGHRLSSDAGRMVYSCREALAGLLGLRDPLRVVFGANATEALNLALLGLLRPGDHVLTTSMEHNAVMRPLRFLEAEREVELTVARVSPRGELDLDRMKRSIRDDTRLIVVNHVSNVTGCVMPLREIGRFARERDVLFLIDAAQSAGAFPIDMEEDLVDLLAVTGHKALYGPMGTGALLMGPRVGERDIAPLKRGGTGSRSEEEKQPDFLPDRYESGTINAVGLAGLLAGIDWIKDRGIRNIQSAAGLLISSLIDGLEALPGIRVHRAASRENQGGTVSFTMENMRTSEIGLALDEEFDILVRVGLHCAPAAHRTIKTFPEGTVRLSIGAFTTREEVDKTVEAVSQLASRRR